jgi:hypothetical protein
MGQFEAIFTISAIDWSIDIINWLRSEMCRILPDRHSENHRVVRNFEPSGATHEAQFISYCRLLPPREIAKSF